MSSEARVDPCEYPTKEEQGWWNPPLKAVLAQHATVKPVRSAILGAALILLTPGLARAHAFIEEPPSRDTAISNLDDRAHKFGPCGGSPRTGMPTHYEVGASIPVKFTETIGHRGCFQIAFSPANDADWVILKQIDDPAGPVGPADMSYVETVKLPAGVSCQACTLAVRQLMKGTACAQNAVPSATDTYYSCADIRVGDFPDAGPSRPPQDAGPGTPSGDDDDGDDDDDVPTEDGGKPASSSGKRLSSAPEASGCSAAAASAAELPAMLIGIASALWLSRRRRGRR